ncbi:MAG TPA: cellulose binding domain-containing protein [Ktedonobacteraceae bacterium]|nr:cellulose binding domain-containing protein [Ktedonobacteraceae bacterium]
MKNSDIHVPQRQRSLSFRKGAFSLVCVFLLSLSAGLALVLVHTPQKAHATNWVEVWNDEFNGSAGAGADSQWQYDLGTGYPCSGCASWGTGEIETMTNNTSNVSQDGNGHLLIKALHNNGSWTSGRIETTNSSFAAPAGGELEVTASLQQPNVSGQSALGYWPAFWMLGSAFRGVYTNWPGIGEIDIMEDINGLSNEYATLHCGTASGGPCNEKNGRGSGPVSCAGCQSGYHTYTVIIDRSSSPEQIRWYLDGGQIFSVSASQMDATTWANAVDHSFFIILDLAMGGAFPNGVCNCTSPTSATTSGASLNVDYVRVFTSSSVANTPTATPTSTTGPGGTACSIHYAITNQWSGGFGASVTIMNTGSTAINGWTLTWTFANGQAITQLWNGNSTQSGSNVSVTNAPYNGTIAPGSNTSFGFNGSWNGTNTSPTSFALNGKGCNVV